MQAQRADVYVLDGRLYGQAMSTTVDGVGIGDGEPAEAKLDDDDEALAGMLVRTLRESRTGIPHPPREAMNQLFDPILRLAGHRQFGEFHRRAALITVERTTGTYRLSRAAKVLEKGSSRTWFEGDASVILLHDPTTAALADAVRELAGLPEVVRVEARAR